MIPHSLLKQHFLSNGQKTSLRSDIESSSINTQTQISISTTVEKLKDSYLFFFFFCCVGSSLLCMGFLQLQRVGATLGCGARASHCGDFSCCQAWALGAWASVVVARGLRSCGSRALGHRLSGWGTPAQLLRGMWDLPGPGLEPISPALAGGFLTAEPPGKPKDSYLLMNSISTL